MNDKNTISNTDPVPINHATQTRIRADVVELARESRALKARLRQRWCEPMGAIQRRLAEIQLATTYRQIALAACRGRFHVVSMPRLGSVPGTNEYYFAAPGARLYSLVRWDPVAHRERVVRALVAIYDADTMLETKQVSA